MPVINGLRYRYREEHYLPEDQQPEWWSKLSDFQKLELEPFPFFDLPAEVRVLVYKAVFANYNSYRRRATLNCDIRKVHPILLASKQVNKEAKQYRAHETHLLIGYLAELTDPSHTPKVLRKATTSISLEHDVIKPSHMDIIKMMINYPKLRKLEVHLGQQHIRKSDDDGEKILGFSKQAIADVVKLDGMNRTGMSEALEYFIKYNAPRGDLHVVFVYTVRKEKHWCDGMGGTDAVSASTSTYIQDEIANGSNKQLFRIDCTRATVQAHEIGAKPNPLMDCGKHCKPGDVRCVKNRGMERKNLLADK